MLRHTLLLFCIGILFYSCSNQKASKEISNTQPNILLIVADDLGFSDIAPFGGNIATPVLSSLSKESVLFSNFHVLPTCSPTRSCLLTGNDNHIAGIGIMSEANYPALENLNLPGYSGALTSQVVTIPELLREVGYHTYMVGKWHLGEHEGQNPFDRGFEQTFILGTGGGSHWNDAKPLAPPQHMEYSRNGKVVSLPEDFYSSKNYTDSLIQFIDRNKTDKKPFFAFLSYTAVHDPLHVPKEYIEKYKGKFDMGWDSLAALRIENLTALGIVPADVKYVKNPAIPAWNTLPEEMRHELARDMEVYAGMLEYMDMSIGRMLDYLKQSGLYDNTLIIFMSDNGANGAMATGYPGNEDGKYLSTFDNSMDNKGLINSYVEAGPGWAQASTLPFRFFKGFVTEGGIHAPLMIKMPGTSAQGGSWKNAFIHVSDIMPTLLQVAGASYPEKHNDHIIHPLIGRSMLPLLHGETETMHTDDGIGYELFEMKAYIKGDWKLLRLPVPFGTGNWELYNIANDPGETTDLSDQHPDIKSALIEAWNNYTIQNEVYDHKGHYDSVYRSIYIPADIDD